MLIAYLGLSTIWDGKPRTLQFQIDGWENQSWGLHDIERRRIRCQVAVASNGSRMNRCEHDYFHHYFISDGHGTERTLYLRPENVGLHIDDEAHKARGGHCSCTWEPFRFFADDSECSRTAEARLPTSTRMGTGRIAGHAVVRYRAVDEKNTETELSLAPGLACEVLEEVRAWRG